MRVDAVVMIENRRLKQHREYHARDLDLHARGGKLLILRANLFELRWRNRRISYESQFLEISMV